MKKISHRFIVKYEYEHEKKNIEEKKKNESPLTLSSRAYEKEYQ